MKRMGVLLMLLTSCCNNPTAKKAYSESSADQKVIVPEKLDSTLVAGVLEFVQFKEYLKYPNIPLDKSFITISFIIDIDSADINFSDSTATITYNIIRDYKGMLDVKGYNVAIFDIGGFGDKYYNKDSLKLISLDEFKSYPMKVISTYMY